MLTTTTSNDLTPYLRSNLDQVVLNARKGELSRLPEDWKYDLSWRFNEDKRFRESGVPYLFSEVTAAVTKISRDAPLDGADIDRGGPDAPLSALGRLASFKERLKPASRFLIGLYNYSQDYGIALERAIVPTGLIASAIEPSADLFLACRRFDQQCDLSAEFKAFDELRKVQIAQRLRALGLDKVVAGESKGDSVSGQQILDAVFEVYKLPSAELKLSEKRTSRGSFAIDIHCDEMSISIPRKIYGQMSESPIAMASILLAASRELVVRLWCENYSKAATIRLVTPVLDPDIHLPETEKFPDDIRALYLSKLAAVTPRGKVYESVPEYHHYSERDKRDFATSILDKLTGTKNSDAPFREFELLSLGHREITLLSAKDHAKQIFSSKVLTLPGSVDFIPPKNSMPTAAELQASSLIKGDQNKSKPSGQRIQPSLLELVDSVVARVDLQTLDIHVAKLKERLNGEFIGSGVAQKLVTKLDVGLQYPGIGAHSVGELSDLKALIVNQVGHESLAKASLGSGFRPSQITVEKLLDGMESRAFHESSKLGLSEIALKIKAAIEVMETEKGLSDLNARVIARALYLAKQGLAESVPGQLPLKHMRLALESLVTKLSDAERNDDLVEVLDFAKKLLAENFKRN